MEPLLIVIALTVALSVFSIVVGLRTRGRTAMMDRLESVRGDRQETEESEGQEGPVFRQRQSYSGIPFLGAVVGQFAGSKEAALSLEKAGLPLRVGEYYIIRMLAAGVFFGIPFLFSSGIFSVVMAIGMAVLGYSLPAIWVSSKKNARIKKMTGQLTEMLGMVANSLKSGYGLMQSFEFAAKQLDPPLATELRRLLRDVNLGMAGEEALQAMGERINIADLDMVLTAINIQRAVGGNLAEILEGVAYTMRERERIRGEITTLTSQQRMTGIVIGGLPIGVGLLFMLINPSYMSLLFTTTVGQIMLLVAVLLEGLGIVAMKKILAIEV